MTATDLVKREAALPAHLNEEQKKLIATTIAPKANENELALFFAVCDRTGLDPFAKQIYLVERWDADAGANVHRAQTSIDGARLVAQRARARGGPAYRPGTSFYYDAEGEEYRNVWLRPGTPAAARVSVFLDGVESPGYAVNFEEVKQTKKDGTLRSNWKKMPTIMLRKCAEMATLRQAFPQELSGLYLDEELEAPVTITHVVEEELATEEQQLALADALSKLLAGDVEQDALDARLLVKYGTAKLAELTRAQADELLERLAEGDS